MRLKAGRSFSESIEDNREVLEWNSIAHQLV